MQVLSKLATGPTASSDVSGAAAWVLQQLGAPTTQRLKLTASAPIHAPYWRRRGLAGQIISPRPQSPYQPLGRPHFQPLQPLASPAALSGPSTFNMREETTRKANRHVARAKSPNHKSRGERARVLKFKARDQISPSPVAVTASKFPPSHFIALCHLKILNHWQRIFSPKLDHTKPVFTNQIYLIQVSL